MLHSEGTLWLDLGKGSCLLLRSSGVCFFLPKAFWEAQEMWQMLDGRWMRWCTSLLLCNLKGIEETTQEPGLPLPSLLCGSVCVIVFWSSQSEVKTQHSEIKWLQRLIIANDVDPLCPLVSQLFTLWRRLWNTFHPLQLEWLEFCKICVCNVL